MTGFTTISCTVLEFLVLLQQIFLFDPNFLPMSSQCQKLFSLLHFYLHSNIGRQVRRPRRLPKAQASKGFQSTPLPAPLAHPLPPAKWARWRLASVGMRQCSVLGSFPSQGRAGYRAPSPLALLMFLGSRQKRKAMFHTGRFPHRELMGMENPPFSHPSEPPGSTWRRNAVLCAR